MAQSLFRVFDEDNSGKLTFYEFVQVKYLSPMRSSSVIRDLISMKTIHNTGCLKKNIS